MTSTPSTRRLLDGVSVQNEAAYERLQLHTAPHVPADAARRRPRISSLRLCLIPPSGMQLSRLAKASRALRVGLAKARVLLTLEERREGVFLSDDAAAAATHRSHRRALVLVREAVALADRQLFDRDLRRRRPFRSAAQSSRRPPNEAIPESISTSSVVKARAVASALARRVATMTVGVLWIHDRPSV